MRLPQAILGWALLGLVLGAAPARADVCEMEWQAFDHIRGPGWTTNLNELMTRENNMRAVRNMAFGNSWPDSAGIKPAQPLAALRKLQDSFARDAGTEKAADAKALLRLGICQLQAMADELEARARPQPARPINTPPAKPATAVRDMKKAPKPAAEIANRCIGLRHGETLYGGFTNACAFPVAVTWCAWHPAKGAWSEAFDCDKDAFGRGGLATIAANAQEASHTHNAEKIFWFACRRPSYPRVTYKSGIGFRGHCE